MAFEMFSDVILIADLPEEELRASDHGTVLEHHVVPGIEEGYTVEFFDMKGETIAVAAVRASLLRSATRRMKQTATAHESRDCR